MGGAEAAAANPPPKHSHPSHFLLVMPMRSSCHKHSSYPTTSFPHSHLPHTYCPLCRGCGCNHYAPHSGIYPHTFPTLCSGDAVATITPPTLFTPSHIPPTLTVHCAGDAVAIIMPTTHLTSPLTTFPTLITHFNWCWCDHHALHTLHTLSHPPCTNCPLCR